MRFLYIIPLLLLFENCSEEKEFNINEYVILIENVEVRTGEITIFANFISTGNEPIKSIGFSFLKSNLPTNFITEGKIFYLSEIPKTGRFTQTIRIDQPIGFDITVRPIIITASNEIYGGEFNFFSEGPGIPDAIDVEMTPTSGFDRTLVTVKSDLLPLNPLIVAKIGGNNNYQGIQIFQTTPNDQNNKSLTFELPLNQYVGKVSIYARDFYDIYLGEFDIIGPVLNSISTLEGIPGDIVEIEGDHLLSNGSTGGVFLFYGNLAMNFLPSTYLVANVISVDKNKIMLQIPSPKSSGDTVVKILYVNGSKSVLYKDTFTIKN